MNLCLTLLYLCLCSTTRMAHLQVVIKYVQTSRRQTPGNRCLQINVYTVFGILFHVVQRIALPHLHVVA